MKTFEKNTTIDRWMKLAESPEATASDLSRLLGDQRARRFINDVFWNKSLPSGAGWTPLPRLGIYEMLCQHGRVFDCLWAPIQEEYIEHIKAHDGFHVSARVEVLEYLSSRVDPIRLSHHDVLDDAINPKVNPGFGVESDRHILFFLPWESIVIAADIVIPNPEKCLILENFAIA